ncbi:Crp/Fnr family transcriptional regulator [Winogradskya humida]|uniref:Crp/Fnr family transcriptional regulator n=1 Tax=Winogradskya humida TaxID=113566 RepID=A0ABQ3ZQC3_9ACTN|nr:Crp/Fnr family transcriptional regulator [Actinoplanes humidus]
MGGVILGDVAQILPSFPPTTLLGRLDPATLDRILALGVRRTVAAGTPLLTEDATETHVIVLRHALTKVSARMADGRQALLDIRVSGDLIGETAALNGTPRMATVTACTTSSFNVIHLHEFRPFLRDNPEAALAVAGTVADRLRRSNRTRVDFASYPVKVRLARVLSEIAEMHGLRIPAGIQLGVHLTQTELAGLCSAAEVSLQKAMRELREAGLVDTGYRRVVVLQPAALRELADL